MAAQGQPRDRKRASAKERAPRGRRRKHQTGDRLNRTQLSERLGFDRKTVSKYLAQDGAPKPDSKMRFSVEEVRKWIEKIAPRIPSNSEEYKNLKLAMLKMDAEEKALDLAERKKELVPKKDIEPTIAAFMSQLTTDLQAKFEHELPPKYEGKTTIEREQLNAAGIDWVLSRLKAGIKPIANA